ncbi:unnamed protein product, partial [Meganyctiphanes norvegica]
VCGCSDGEVSCENICVPYERQCDGIPDCPLRQDESVELCSNRGCTRNDFLSGDPFRCKYGACIDQLFTCNGIANCADGSDETPELCKSKKCGNREFKCEYGACINHRRKCDGAKSCHYDGSDETLEACGNSRCRSDKFRCNYGACIFQRKRCDGKVDCLDSSDESEDVCGAGHMIIMPATTPTSTQTTVESSPVSAMCSPKQCQCPPPLQHLCLPCSPNLNLTCAAIERNTVCHLTNEFEENVELDILDCGGVNEY